MGWTATALADPVSNAANLSANLKMVAVSPWTNGVKEGSGTNTWLSFPNAVDAVLDQLDLGLGPGEAVFALAISASNFKDFADQLGQMAQAFSLKQLSQWQRQAQTLVTLEIEKLNLPDGVVEAGGMVIEALPTVKAQIEKATSQDALAEASSLAGLDPLAELTTFETAKLAHDALVSGSLPALSGGSGYRLYADSDFADAFKTNALGSEYTMTSIIAWVGLPDDLSFLVELMP